MRKSIIGVDFDGTIAVTHYPEIIEIIPEAQLYLRKWRKHGAKLILWTCREGKELQDAIDFCLKHGIQFDGVNENLPEMIAQHNSDPRKLGADYFIDDKCPVPIQIQFKTLHQILEG